MDVLCWLMKGTENNSPWAWIIVGVVMLIPVCFSGQVFVSGKLLDKDTHQPVAYALISDAKRSVGSLSNEHGDFILELSQGMDSLIIESIGYVTKRMVVAGRTDLGEVLMMPEIAMLSEVNIRPEDDAFLFDLLESCRKNVYGDSHVAKAYLELKSFDSGGQIELLESYQNVRLRDYEIEELTLKTGRVALRKREGNFFLSMEATRAIALMKVLKPSDYFMNCPLSFPKKQARRKFRLHQKGKYTDESKHELMLISFKPSQGCTNCFEGRIIIDVTAKKIRQINYICQDCAIHPFVPVFPDDQLGKVSMNLTKKFDENGVLQQINFQYGVQYISRIGQENENRFEITTQAILHVYQIDQPFFAPQFYFPDGLSDYKKLAAIPEQLAFWNQRTEMRLDANVAENEKFFSHDSSMTNEELFRQQSEIRNRLLRYQYVQWSDRRILLGGVVDDTISHISDHVPLAERYRLKAQIFLDVNELGDSLVVTTKAIFDPYQSYYYLPQDSVTNAFINMYFDLAEVQRRKLEWNLSTGIQNKEAMLLEYQKSMEEFDGVTERFFRAVDRGTQKEKMMEWNDRLKAETGIDNLKLFGVYQHE